MKTHNRFFLIIITSLAKDKLIEIALRDINTGGIKIVKIFQHPVRFFANVFLP